MATKVREFARAVHEMAIYGMYMLPLGFLACIMLQTPWWCTATDAGLLVICIVIYEKTWSPSAIEHDRSEHACD